MADEHSQQSDRPAAGAPEDSLVPAAHITQFPVEILEKIFGHLMFKDKRDWMDWRQYSDETQYRHNIPYMSSRPDKTDIRNLRMTCKAFEDLAASMLFRHMKLSYYLVDLDNFLRVSFSPILSRHVKSLSWDETMAAVGFDNTPEHVKTRMVSSFSHGGTNRSAHHQGLLTKVWGHLCWNQGLTCVKPRRPNSTHSAQADEEKAREMSSVDVDGMVRILAAAIRNLQNLQKVTSIPMRDQTGHPSTIRVYQKRHIPTIFPLEFAEVDTLQPMHDRYLNLHQMGSMMEEHDPEFLNDGFFRFIAPALAHNSGESTKLLDLCLVDERCALEPRREEQGCLRRFGGINPEAFSNITEIKFILSFDHLYYGSGYLSQRYAWAMAKCIESATQLRNLVLVEVLSPTSSARTVIDRNPFTRPGHFFDLLVWGEEDGDLGMPRTNPSPGLRWPYLKCLVLEGIHFSQLSLLRLLAVHAKTFTQLRLFMAPLEFRTVKVLAKIPQLTIKNLLIIPPLGAADAHPRPVDYDEDGNPQGYVRDVEHIPARKLMAFINNYKPSRVGNLVSMEEKWRRLGLPIPLPLPESADGAFGKLQQKPPSPNYNSANFYIRTQKCPASIGVRGWWINRKTEEEKNGGPLTAAQISQMQEDRHRTWYERDSKEDRERWEQVRSEERRAFDFRDWISDEEEPQNYHPAFDGPDIVDEDDIDETGMESRMPPKHFDRFTQQELRCVFAGLRSPDDETVEDDRGKVIVKDKDTVMKDAVSTASAVAGASGGGSGTGSVGVSGGRCFREDMPQVFDEEAPTLARVLRLTGAEAGVLRYWDEIRRAAS